MPGVPAVPPPALLEQLLRAAGALVARGAGAAAHLTTSSHMLLRSRAYRRWLPEPPNVGWSTLAEVLGMRTR
jgi:hypothetical protein